MTVFIWYIDSVGWQEWHSACKNTCCNNPHRRFFLPTQPHGPQNWVNSRKMVLLNGPVKLLIENGN